MSTEYGTEADGQMEALSVSTDIDAMSDREVVDNVSSLINDSEIIAWMSTKRSEITFDNEEFAAAADMIRRVYGYEQGYYSVGASGDSGVATMASNGTVAWTPGGAYSAGIGMYPIQKGKILATADWAAGIFPLGHAAIVYDRFSAWTSFPKIVSPAYNGTQIDGVQQEPNNWNSPDKHSTCFGLDVIATNSSQEASATDWCARQSGKSYNWNYLGTATRSSFYCSQLVWAAYKDNFGIDLNTDEYKTALGNPVHPMELVHSSRTSLVYRQGTAETGWSQVNDSWYYIDSKGNPLKGGWRWTDSTNGWRYFAPTGVMVSSLQVSPGSMLNTGKRMDMGWSTMAGTQMQIWSRTGGDNERWDLFTMDGTNWYIQSRYSEMYVAVPGGNVYNCAPIIQWTYTGGNEQKWRLVQHSDGSYQFRSALNTNYVIDVTSGATANATKLQLYYRNDTPAQRWKFMEVW
jgi:uncharacterized protein YycO